MKRGQVMLELGRPDGGCVRVTEVERDGSTYAVLERVTPDDEADSAGEVITGVVGVAVVEIDRLVDVLVRIRSRKLGAPVRGEVAARVQEAAGARERRGR